MFSHFDSNALAAYDRYERVTTAFGKEIEINSVSIESLQKLLQEIRVLP